MKKSRGMVLNWPAALANVGVKPTSTRWLAYVSSADASATVDLYDPGAGNKFVLVGFTGQCAAAATPVKLLDGAGAIAGSGTLIGGDMSNAPYISTTTANKLRVDTGAAGQTDITAWGYTITA